MASISKYETQKGSYYKCTIYVGINPDTGKQINKTKRGFKTKKEANQWADRERVAIARGARMAAPERKTFEATYKEWYEQYILSVKPSTATKTEELFRLHILPSFGKKRLQTITRRDIQNQVNHWYQYHSHYKTMYNYTKRLLDYAVLSGYLATNPCIQIELPRKNKPTTNQPTHWTKQELAAFLEACKQDPRKEIYPFFRLLAYTGIRRGEILALEWTDLHNNTITIRQAISRDQNKQITISTPKTQSSLRTIPLDIGTLNALSDWQQYTTGKYIFGGNKPLTDSLPRKWMHQICKQNNLQPIKIHGLRHTHCTLLFESGATPKEIQERLGHASAEITLNIYTHLTQTTKESTANNFANFMET